MSSSALSSSSLSLIAASPVVPMSPSARGYGIRLFTHIISHELIPFSGYERMNVLKKVFTYLSQEDKRRLLCVCKNFYSTIRSTSDIKEIMLGKSTLMDWFTKSVVATLLPFSSINIALGPNVVAGVTEWIRDGQLTRHDGVILVFEALQIPDLRERDG